MFLHWEQTAAGRFRVSSLEGRRFHNASNEGRQGQCGSNTPRRARKTIRWSLCGGSSSIKLRCLRKKRLPKVLNCSDKCFPCTFWNRVVKLSIHERLAPLRRGCADAADSSAFTAPHELNVRDIVLGNQMRNGDSENADRAHALPGLWFSAPPPSGAQSGARGACTAASDAHLPPLASWMRSASHTHVEQYQSGSIVLVQQRPEPSYPTAGGAGVGCSNWDESRASPAPGAG